MPTERVIRRDIAHRYWHKKDTLPKDPDTDRIFMSVKLTKMDAGRDGSEVLMMKQIGVSSEEGICSASQLLAKKQEADQDQIRRDYPTCDLGRVIKTVAAYIAFFGGVSLL